MLRKSKYYNRKHHTGEIVREGSISALVYINAAESEAVFIMATIYLNIFLFNIYHLSVIYHYMAISH